MKQQIVMVTLMLVVIFSAVNNTYNASIANQTMLDLGIQEDGYSMSQENMEPCGKGI